MWPRLVIAATLAGAALAADSIRGIAQSDDGHPLPIASRIDLECAGETVSSSAVDEGGRFEITRAGPLEACSLAGRAAGHGAARVAVGDLPANPKIPAIVLPKLGKSDGESISTTHLAAPPEAVRHFHAAMRQLRNPGTSYDATLEHLRAAVDSYPGYAEAWFQIGRLELALGNAGGALAALEEAVRADPWFVSPYEPLILLLRAAGERGAASAACSGLRRINPQLPENCGAR